MILKPIPQPMKTPPVNFMQLRKFSQQKSLKRELKPLKRKPFVKKSPDYYVSLLKNKSNA